MKREVIFIAAEDIKEDKVNRRMAEEKIKDHQIVSVIEQSKLLPMIGIDVIIWYKEESR